MMLDLDAPSSGMSGLRRYLSPNFRWRTYTFGITNVNLQSERKGAIEGMLSISAKKYHTLPVFYIVPKCRHISVICRAPGAISRHEVGMKLGAKLDIL